MTCNTREHRFRIPNSTVLASGLLRLASATSSPESAQHRHGHVVVQVRSGKTKMIQCEPQSTVGAMRAEIGVPLGQVIMLVPGSRELDDEMRLGEIVMEGPLTVEVRCRGVGGGAVENEALCQAASEGYVTDVRRLLAAGVDANATMMFRHSALHLAAAKNYVEVVQMLLKAGANVNATNTQGTTPLHRAALFGHLEVVQLLVGVGANVDATDEWERTPLHGAALHGHLEVSQVLIGAGANVHATNINGHTPLDKAKQHGHGAVVASMQESETLTKSASAGQGGAHDARQ